VIPQTAAALLAFLFLVAPGIVFENLRERRRPTFDQTTFREVSRLALASLWFSVLSLVLLAGLRAGVPAIMPDPGRWLREGNRYVQSNYQVVGWFFLAEVLIAIGLAAAWSWWLGRGKTSDIRRISAWYKVFRHLPPTGSEPFVRVFVEGGTEYYGKVQYRDGLEPDEQQGYDELLAEAKHVERLPFIESTEQAHLAAGQAVADRSDRLVAVWDGKPARAIGGTADIVSYARQKGVPVIVLWPEGAMRE
jgi:hypothetical protein